ncbi:MAG: C39 family peptidase [Kiritimatiellaeota bacterium]|nr:C39 family peptidase [Kiritimatiellota bacterium]
MKKHIALTVIAGCLLATTGAQSASLPPSHFIANVPWHTQINGLLCGAGSLNIVFDYWGPDLNQKAIADVARSSSIGTWCFDVQRAGHFSLLSAAQGNFYPAEAPTAGFPERPLGYASFGHAAPTIWLHELKALIAADIPVIMLMPYDADSTSGGHYRVAIGYDDAQGVIFFSDPWGRDLKYLPGLNGVIAWTYAQVEVGWNYVAYGTPQPFYGVAIMPWKVGVAQTKGKLKAGSTITVTATVNYPCPAPFSPMQFPASDASASIALPAGLTLLGAQTVALGNMTASATKTVSWQVRVDQVPAAGAAITVQAGGVVSGSVPEANWTGQSQSYPPYSYTDLIGGTGSLAF